MSLYKIESVEEVERDDAEPEMPVATPGVAVVLEAEGEVVNPQPDAITVPPEPDWPTHAVRRRFDKGERRRRGWTVVIGRELRCVANLI